MNKQFSQESKVFIIAKESGQLGNRLVLFAHFIAFAIENNLVIMNSAFDEYADFFETTSKDSFCCYPPKLIFKGNKVVRKGFRLLTSFAMRLMNFATKNKVNLNQAKIITANNWQERVSLDSPKFYSSLKHQKVIFTQGYCFRANSYFADNADRIREYFTPIEKYRYNVLSLINSIKSSSDILVGVHIRHGDYKTWKNGKYFFSIEQYVEIMKQVKKVFFEKTVAFLICSNANCDKNIFADFNVAFGSNHILEDMYALAQCDYIIGVPSSYNRWAAFYGSVPLYTIERPEENISLDSFKVYQVPQC